MPEDREEEEQQEGYHKVDRRVGHRDEEPTEEAAEAPVADAVLLEEFEQLEKRDSGE